MFDIFKLLSRKNFSKNNSIALFVITDLKLPEITEINFPRFPGVHFFI